MYIVKLEEKCWLAPWAGDPGRTTLEKNARKFKTKRAAKRTMELAQQIRPFKFAKIIKVSS